MRRRRTGARAVLCALALAGVLAAACGGGGGGNGGGGGGRLTDPASVATATPVAEPRVIQVGEGGNVEGGSVSTPSVQQTYTIQSGDNCPLIAELHGITVDQLMTANPDINADCTNLIAGEDLLIPAAGPGASATATPAGPAQNLYTIQPGDDCASIAAVNGITDEALRGANPGINAECTNLIAGETLVIPDA